MNRIQAIQSPVYNNQNGQNQSIFNLEMKQPTFNLPNSLTILKKYKKQRQSGNKDEGKADDGTKPNSLAGVQVMMAGVPGNGQEGENPINLSA